MVLATLEPTVGMKCIQHILLAFNAIFTFTGVILISVGSTVNNIYTDYAAFVEARFFSPSIVIISIGILVLVIALFGCYGAFKLSVAAIMVYTILLATVFVLETVAGIAGYILEDQLEDMLVKTMNQTVRDYEKDIVTANTIDALQYELHCCGIMGPQDWSEIISSEYPHETIVPISCCAYYDRGVCIAIKRMGCLPQLEYLLDQSSLLLTSTVLMIALMQLLGVIFAFKLGRQLRKQKSLRDRFKWEVKESILSGHLEASKTSPEPEYCRLPSYSELFSSTDVNEKPEAENKE